MVVKTRIKYFDTLKFLAITGVIFLHCFILKDTVEILNFNVVNLNQIGRFGVPLFLLISGALLLNREIELKSFFKKRFVRICYPLIFFIILAYVLKIYLHPLTAFWYCWMVIGTYLAIPLINIFVKYASEFGNVFDIYPKMNLASTLDLGILQIIQVSSVFLIVKNIYSEHVTGIFSVIKGVLETKIINGFILSVSRASYGMYLVHMLFLRQYIRPYFETLELSSTNMFIAFLVTFIGVFLVSWIITVILGKIPYVNKISGYA